ncbi:hypothetical protein MBANPS3_000588 [Mucor bainieri]
MKASWFGYQQYHYLLVIDVDTLGTIQISGSSNRVQYLETWIGLRHDHLLDIKLGLFVKDIFPIYFELHAKNREQLSETEMLTLTTIFELFESFRLRLLRELGTSLDSTHIIFVTPPMADWDTTILHAFFLEAGWITPEDESRLMFVPFIEAHVNYLQSSALHKEDFQRERKYMLLFMQPTEEGDHICYTSICFQMQCAKELIALSKRLASSDYLLVPSILSSRSVCLPVMDEALLAAGIEKIIRHFRNEYMVYYEAEKSKYAASLPPPTRSRKLLATIKGATSRIKNKFGTAPPVFGDQSQDATIAEKLTWVLLGRRHSFFSESTIGSFLPNVNFEKCQLQHFRDLPIGHLLKELTHDPSIQQHTQAVCDFLQASLSEYGSVSNAPDGVRRVTLSYDGQCFDNGPHCLCIEDALSRANIIKPQVKFSQSFSHPTGALQRSLKINQIISTLLPAYIVDKEETDEVDAVHHTHEEDTVSLPLNSFYLQANINERQINFIVNKVVKASTTETPAELFTAEERTVDIDDIQTAASNNVWNQYQLLESEGCLSKFVICCQEHQGSSSSITLLSLDRYQCFTENMASFTNDWVRSGMHL